jgi:hypothetical protein
VYALFIDLSKALDLVHHDLLWSKLYNVGLSMKFVQNLQHIYRCAKAKVRTKFGEGDFIDINNGVLQGESLSPKLFTLFLEDIINVLDSANICSIKIGTFDLNILLYADDLVLLAYNIRIVDLQEKIRVVEAYFAKNGLVINLQKTKNRKSFGVIMKLR